MQLAISSIRTDGGTQPRAAIDFDAVEAYTEAMEAGAQFPPVDVFYDGAEYWLADGFHRIRAAFGAGRDEIEAVVHQGTVDEARWFSFGANKSNGLYRSNSDKQRAVKAALEHPKSSGMSDNAIAKHVGVHHDTVGEWRRKLMPPLAESASETPASVPVSNAEPQKRLCADGRVMNVSNIGRRAEPAPAPQQYAPQQYVPDPQAPARMPEPEPEISVEQESLAAICDAVRVINAIPMSSAVLAEYIASQPDSSQIVNDLEIAREYVSQIIELQVSGSSASAAGQTKRA